MRRTTDPNSRLVYSTDEETDRHARVPAAETKTGGPAGKTRPTQSGQARGPGIRLRLERRASDRVVTVVTGLPGSEKDLAALARALKSACGTGGTVKGGALELQGDHRDAVEAALLARGLPSKRAGG